MGQPKLKEARACLLSRMSELDVRMYSDPDRSRLEDSANEGGDDDAAAAAFSGERSGEDSSSPPLGFSDLLSACICAVPSALRGGALDL